MPERPRDLCLAPPVLDQPGDHDGGVSTSDMRAEGTDTGVNRVTVGCAVLGIRGATGVTTAAVDLVGASEAMHDQSIQLQGSGVIHCSLSS